MQTLTNLKETNKISDPAHSWKGIQNDITLRKGSKQTPK